MDLQSESVVVVVTNQIQPQTLPANSRESAGLGTVSLGNLQHLWWDHWNLKLELRAGSELGAAALSLPSCFFPSFPLFS